MHVLRRTVRVNVLPAGSAAGAKNTYAGYPTMTTLGAFYSFEVAVRGEPNADTGYLRDIKHIDRAVRETVVPTIATAFGSATAEPAELLASTLPVLDRAIGGGLQSVRWFLSPYYCLEVAMPAAPLPAAPQTEQRAQRVLIRERFDFAAAHRLHVPQHSDDANRATFGKCNNLKGHGHNYQFEPCVSVPIAGANTAASPFTPFTIATLEKLADEIILERFDHKHLNEDTIEFDNRRGGVNPSVENIAHVFFTLLEPHITKAGGTLINLTVWETDRTSATFPA